MKVLLDTNIILWVLSGDSRLSDRITEIVLSQDNTISFSIASLWEIALKHHSGKLNISAELASSAMKKSGAALLTISEQHIYNATALPFHHKDPFDRMLVAQAQVESMVLITSDHRLSLYGIDTILLN